ncbi:hypothetical protein [Notoacmeibacter marinus]|nr:hypothetical protein [Notoacmeibacter marinus]
MKRKKEKINGVCRLTGEFGRFVDSHLLPKALTRADGVDPYLIQAGYGRTMKRFSSWYDRRLVTSAGEKILAEYDNWAIRELRKQKLVWSGWGPMQSLTDVNFFAADQWGTRTLKGTDWKYLRLFFLSLLWRAAASNLKEFSEISLSDSDLERLRNMIVDGNPEPLEFFPTTLTQLSTLGVNHNHAPMAEQKIMPSTSLNGTTWKMPIFRFYIDGLIIHFSRLAIEENQNFFPKFLTVGCQDELVVTTLPYKGSFQAQNLMVVQMESTIGRALPEEISQLISEPARQHMESILESLATE